MKKMRKPMRNPAACNPLMRKGGPHQPGRQTVRPRLDWRDVLEDYDDWQQEEENKEGPDGPSFVGTSFFGTSFFGVSYFGLWQTALPLL
ncbi:hypothetical protein GCM10007426_37610 [Alloalcanivorax dieselolei]|nr:hypothetical protein [Alloalcanivorax dieselolei]GGK05338.1 hypothetical protein GCM10007426_37610 [Alloalcanivorax dieselolei]